MKLHVSVTLKVSFRLSTKFIYVVVEHCDIFIFIFLVLVYKSLTYKSLAAGFGKIFKIPLLRQATCKVMHGILTITGSRLF